MKPTLLAPRLALRPLACAVLLTLPLSSTWAFTKTWACASGDWRNAACWQPAGLPTIEDTARLQAVNNGNAQIRFSALDGAQAFDHLTISGSSGASAHLSQSGGTLSPQVSTTVGLSGTGRYTMLAGTLDTGRFTVGQGLNGRGTVNLAQGTLSTAEAYIGRGTGASGTMVQNGGHFTAADWLHIGRDGGSGSYLMLAGALSSGELVIGHSGRGGLNQYGGKVATDVLQVGSGASGSYVLSGQASVLNSRATNVGINATGTFTQGGGTHVVENRLTIGTQGSYRLLAGLITTGYEGGVVNQGSLVQTGGRISGAFSNWGRYTFNGGTVAGQVFNNGTMVMGGGTVAGGDMSNAGSLSGRGTLGGDRLRNSGTLTASGGDLVLNMGEDTYNHGQIVVASTGRLVNNVSTLRNSGVIRVNGGSLGGSGEVLNTSSGLIAAQGSLGGVAIQNQGTIELNAGAITVSAQLGNQAGGTVSLQAGAQAVWSGALHNQGSVHIAAQASADFAGLVSGAGTLSGEGSVRFLDAFKPGNSPASVTVDVASTFASTSWITLDIGGTTAGDCNNCHDKVTFLKDVQLDGGTLQLDLYGNFQGQAGDVFDLFDWQGGVTGQFGGVVLPVLQGNLYWDTADLYGSGDIRIAALAPLGEPMLMMAASAAVVPEAGSLGMAFAGLLMALGVTHRQRRTRARG